jgi:hypothetical protein
MDPITLHFSLISFERKRGKAIEKIIVIELELNGVGDAAVL